MDREAFLMSNTLHRCRMEKVGGGGAVELWEGTWPTQRA